MGKNVRTVFGVGVIALAALMVTYPELRIGSMRLAFMLMWAVLAVSLAWRLYKGGVLSRTPGEIYRMTNRPKIGLVEYLAIMSVIVVTLVPGH